MKLKNRLKANKIFLSRKYLAAVSGGPDSMAMLDTYKKNIKVVCHVNYHKRVESHVDTTIVKKYCKANNIILEILDVTQSMYDEIKNSNFQTQARIIRYAFFEEISNKYKLNKILIAHHYDDFLETAYMQELRGSASPFYGIKESNKINNLQIFRPFISKRKQELIDYCNNNKILFAIDSSNYQDIYKRNETRKIISSWNKKEFDNFCSRIWVYNKKKYWVSIKQQSLYKKWQKKEFDCSFLKKKDHLIKRNLVYKLLIEKNIPNPSINKNIQIITLIDSQNNNGNLRIGNNTFVTKKNNKLVFINGNKFI